MNYRLLADMVLVAVVFGVAAAAEGPSPSAFRAFTQSLRHLGVPALHAGAPRVAAAIIGSEFAAAALFRSDIVSSPR